MAEDHIQPYKLQRRYYKVELGIQIARVQMNHVCIFPKDESLMELFTQPRSQGSLLPAQRSERKRDPAKRWSRGSRTK